MRKCLEQVCSSIGEAVCCMECELLAVCEFPCENVELGLTDECPSYIEEAEQLGFAELLEGEDDYEEQ